MENFRPPAAIKFTSSNLAEQWIKWKQQFLNFLIASERDKKSDEVKIAILLNLVGEEGVGIFNTFKPSENKDIRKFDNVMEMFNDYCMPKKNVVFERFKFFSCTQQEGQQIDNYLTELKTLASTCSFGNQENDLIRDRLVLGIREKCLLERLLRETELTLEKAAEFLRAAETSKMQLETVTGATRVHEIKRKPARTVLQASNRSDKFKCHRCGREHSRGSCPAFGRMCAKCKQKNHFAAVCKTHKPFQKKVNQIENTDMLDENACLFIDSVKFKNKCMEIGSVTSDSVFGINSVDNVWLTTVDVEGNNIEFKLDSGAEANVLPLKVFNNMTLSTEGKLHETKVTLLSYGNFELKPKGEVVLKCKHNDNEIFVKFIVVDVMSKPILGLKTCQVLNLIKKVHILKSNDKDNVINENIDLFQKLGKFPGEPYHIELKEGAKPVVDAPRRVPIALHKKLKSTLDELEAQKIVRKVNKPTDWVNSLVVVEKPNGNLRICLDPRNLNKCIKREHHIIPTAEELISRLEGKTVFSVLDLKNGFWHVPLDSDSADLCTFNSPFGRYQFLRLPFGIISAPEVFQKRNVQIFHDIEGVEIYFDDIIVTGRDGIEHDKTLNKVFERARECDIKFNAEKFQYRVSEVKYVGQIVSKEGIRADPQHIRAITEMRIPTDKDGVRRFLGLVSYLSKFIPNVSTITSPLRNLLKDKVDFNWLTEHEVSFKKIKDLLSSSSVLKVFNGSKPSIIQCDSSKDGIGACLIQEGHPISYASRSLTATEQNYAQIEKEMLAIVFAVQKYHNFVYGKRFVVQSDHKPLTSIVNKPMHAISSRLQRMLLKLIKYQFEIVYVKGSEMYLADTLSRSYLEDRVSDDPDMLDVIHVVKQLPISERRVEQFIQAIHGDPVLSLVYNYCENGWPNKIQKVPPEVKHFYKFKNELYIDCGLLLKDSKIVVPSSLRHEMLLLIHEGHFGIEKSKNRAREIMYWPNMAKDIESLILKCEVCQKFQRTNVKEPLLSHALPTKPFEKIAIDIMDFQNVGYLVIVCYYSKWIEVIKLNTKTITEIKKKLKKCFSRYGIPSIVVSDNSPFNSFEFKSFAKEWDFECVFTSPRYPRSNGMAESAVGIAKSILKKAFEDRKEWVVALMEYRNTPITGLNLSPAQLLYGRRLKTKIPIHNKLLNVEVFNNLDKQFLKKQLKQKQYYDKGASKLKPLNVGDKVTVYNFNEHIWEPAQVMERCKNPRSFKIKTMSGKELIRNRVHLRPTLSEFESKYESDCEFPVLSSSGSSVTNIPIVSQNQCASAQNQTRTVVPQNKCAIGQPRTRSGRVVNRPRYLGNYMCDGDG